MKKVLSILQLLVGLSAIISGYGIVMGHGLGMPLNWLDGSPFHSYLIPGLVLFFIVGGSYVLSSVTTWMSHQYAPQMASIAGFGIMIWIFTEMYIVRQSHWLQILYFSIGIATIVSVLIYLRYYLFRQTYSN
jgi:hypothetical protein